MHRLRPLATVMLLGSAGAHAQSMDYGSLEALFGEPVTTSVTGSPQRASAAPATLDIITAEEIRRSGAVHLAGVLRQVSGVDLLQWTASHNDVAVRGYNKAFYPRLLVLVNGRQIYADHYGYVPWAALPVELGEIRQIEVVKGPNSALFGFNAVAGVINIVTYSPTHDDVAYVTGRVGSQEHAELSAAATLRPTERLALRVSAGYRESEDFDTPLSPVNQGVRQGDKRESLRLDVHYQASSWLEVELEGTSTNVTQTAMSPSYSMAWEDKQIESLKLGLHADTGYGLSELQVYRNWIDNDVYATTFNLDDFSYSFNPEPLANFDNTLTLFSAKHVFRPTPGHTLRVGGEYRESRLPTAPLKVAEVSYDVIALTGMWEWRLVDAVTLTLAAREDHLQLARHGGIPPALGLDNDDWDVDLHVTSYNAALLWQIDAGNVLRLNAGRGMQLPSLYNLGGSLFPFPLPAELQPPEFGYFAGLPSVKPSTVDAIELSWEHAAGNLPASLRVSAFYNETRQIIADGGYSDLSAGIFSAPANVGASTSQGVEVALEADYDIGLGWSLGYVYQEIDDDLDPQFPEWITYTNFDDTTAQHLVNGSLHFTRGPWEADAFLYYKSDFGGLRVADSFVFDPNNPAVVPDVLTQLDAYTTLDLHLGYRINERLRVDLQARNLVDSPQMQTSGPQVERRLMGSVRYSF